MVDNLGGFQSSVGKQVEQTVWRRSTTYLPPRFQCVLSTPFAHPLSFEISGQAAVVIGLGTSDCISIGESGSGGEASVEGSVASNVCDAPSVIVDEYLQHVRRRHVIEVLPETMAHHRLEPQRRVVTQCFCSAEAEEGIELFYMRD